MDPLLIIRKANIAHTEFVNESNEYYIIGQNRLPSDKDTCFKKTLKTGGYYTVRDIIFYLKHKDASFQEYRTAVQEEENNVSAVTNQDKTKLQEYLNGMIDTCEQIDINKQKEQRGEARSREKSATAASNNNNNNADDNADDDVDSNEAQLEQLRLVAEGLRKVVESGNDSDEIKNNFKLADQAYLKMLIGEVIPAYTRTTIMDASGTKDFSFGKDLFLQVLRQRDENKAAGIDTKKMNTLATATNNKGVSSSSKRPRESSIADKTNKPAAKRKATGPPIIIVPNSLTTVISSINIKDFLEGGTYISISDKKKQGGKRQQIQSLQLKMNLNNGTKQEFKVTDNPSTLKAHEWENVVAIFVTGQAWQFKPLKWSNPVDLFQHVLGVHLTLDLSSVTPSVHSWKCKVVRLNASMRHLDTGAVNDFITSLRKFMEISKPWLLKD